MMSVIARTRTPGTRKRSAALCAALAGGLLLAACADMDITNTNAPTVDELTDSPNRAVMALAATGIFARAFNNVGTEIAFYALYGREGYNLQGNDPRETGEQISGPLVATGRGGGIWAGPYSTIRTINTYLAALPVVGPAEMTDAEKRASAGFAKTVKAWQIYRLAVRTGDLGIPLDVDRPINAEPAPFVSFEAALAAASALMDEALTDLQAGSADFPFTMAPGYDGFDTPATFALFNRALAAKILVERATFVDCASCWAEASTAMDASFVTTAGLPASLDGGVYYAYSSAANETSNPIADPLSSNQYWIHPSIVSGAQERADGSPDLRLTMKVIEAEEPREHNELVGTHKPILYNNPTNPEEADLGAWIPWISNEELLLLRAEIRWNTANRAGAIADIDLVREHAGGLEPTSLTAGSSDAEFIDELLYNRLYSLMWEQGTRWIDARRYDRLDTLPIDREGDQVFENMLVPAAECAARELPVPCEPLTQ